MGQELAPKGAQERMKLQLLILKPYPEDLFLWALSLIFVPYFLNSKETLFANLKSIALFLLMNLISKSQELHSP